MSRKIKILLMFVVCFIFIASFKNVSAKQVIYTNKNGISLDKYEYVFFTQVYGEKFLKYLDEETYNQYSDIDFKHAEVESHTYTVNPGDANINGTYYSTSAKSIKITKLCGSILCRTVITATWLGEPTVKSYDVIGAYLDGPTRISTPATVVYSDSDSDFDITTKYGTNGYGAVVKIPEGNDVVVTQNFAYTGSGKIYATYQHAMSTSTLQIAQKFNISATGFGGVLDFYDEAYNIYDNMNGVDIDV